MLEIGKGSSNAERFLFSAQQRLAVLRCPSHLENRPRIWKWHEETHLNWFEMRDGWRNRDCLHHDCYNKGKCKSELISQPHLAQRLAHWLTHFSGFTSCQDECVLFVFAMKGKRVKTWERKPQHVNNSVWTSTTSTTSSLSQNLNLCT